MYNNIMKRICGSLHGRMGKIAYYGGVALALCAIALAAETYRQEEQPSQLPVVLPAVAEKPVEMQPVFSCPEDMQLLRGYSAAPAWDAYLDCWRTHPAVDLQFGNDCVYSLSDGVISAIGKSGVCGGFVEIQSGEYLLRYASLAVVEQIEPGQNIKAGDVLGIAGQNMPSEAGMQPHVHLEVQQGEEYLDFQKIRNIMREKKD